MIPDPRDRPTLSVPEAGAYVGLGRSAAFDAARRGELPTIRFGRRLAVPTALLRQMLGIDAASDSSDSEAPVEGEVPRLALLTDAEERGSDAG